MLSRRVRAPDLQVRVSTSVEELEPNRAKPGSSLFSMEGLLGWPEGSRAKRCPGSGPLPASRVSATFYPHDAGTPHPPRHSPGPSPYLGLRRLDGHRLRGTVEYKAYDRT